MQANTPRKLLLIGWDAADWKMIHPLMDAGEMPNLRRLVEGGVSGNLRTLEPALSPLLWTTIATGKTADQHGILGFLEPDPLSGGARTIASTTRRGKAFWNILHQASLQPHVVNWYASHPAEPIRGVCVSNAFCPPSANVPTGAVHPVSLERELLGLRVLPTELSGSDLAMFIPELSRVDQAKDRRPMELAKVLAEGLTVHAIATWILEKQPWDCVAMFMDTVDHAGHFFMQHHPPRMESTPEADFEIYRGVMNHVYRFHDLLLGRLVQLAGPEATVMILSDHGFHSGDTRPTGESLIPMEANLRWHRQHGMFCLAGPGIRKDELLHGAGLLDITPTVLALFGLPAGKDMPGRVLAEAFVDPPALAPVESWDAQAGDAGLHPEDIAASSWDSSAAIEQLAALGYVDPATESMAKRREGSLDHQSLNLARVHLSGGRAREAAAEIEKLLAKYPGQPGLLMLMAKASLRAGDHERVRQILPEESTDAGWLLVKANLCLAEGDGSAALEHLLAAEDRIEKTENWYLLIGRVHQRLGRSGDAERSFRAAAEINPQSARAWRGVAVSLLNQPDRAAEAAEAALEATGHEFSHATGHYVLGVALARTGAAGKAAQAFEVCLRLQPAWMNAHRWLAALHERATGDLERARYHREQADALAGVATAHA